MLIVKCTLCNEELSTMNPQLCQQFVMEHRHRPNGPT